MTQTQATSPATSFTRMDQSTAEQWAVIRQEVRWTIAVHQDFQGRHYYHHFGFDREAREQHRGHPAYALAERFADEWDQVAFDPDYDTLPLEHFEERLRAVFGSKTAF